MCIPILVEANWVWRHLQQIGHWPYFHIYFGCGMLDIPLYPTTKPHSGLPIPTSYFSDIILNSRAANVIYHGFANLAACFPLVGRSNEDRDGAAKTKSDCQFRLVGPPIWSIEGCEGHTALSTPGTVQVLGYNMNICYIVYIYIYTYIMFICIICSHAPEFIGSQRKKWYQAQQNCLMHVLSQICAVSKRII